MSRTSRWLWSTGSVAIVHLCGCGGDELVLGGGGNSDCVPGTYAGHFDCANADASAGPFSVAFQVQGDISFDLQGDPGGKTLVIGPGAKATALFDGGPALSGDLSGTLDCTTDRFDGTLSNLTSPVMPGVLVTSQVETPFSAQYDAEGGSPKFADGVLIISFGATISQTCTWDAGLQP